MVKYKLYRKFNGKLYKYLATFSKLKHIKLLSYTDYKVVKVKGDKKYPYLLYLRKYGGKGYFTHNDGHKEEERR